MANDLYKVPNQIEFDGIKYTGGQHTEILTKIRDDLELTKGDILSVSYPKTGQWFQLRLLSLFQFLCENMSRGEKKIRRVLGGVFHLTIRS